VTATTIARSLVERAWVRTAHFSRFTAVGAAGLAVNQAAFWLLEGHMHYLLAAALATIASTTFNFTFIEAWVFRLWRSQQRRVAVPAAAAVRAHLVARHVFGVGKPAHPRGVDVGPVHSF